MIPNTNQRSYTNKTMLETAFTVFKDGYLASQVAAMMHAPLTR
jgi:hypothetical protein